MHSFVLQLIDGCCWNIQFLLHIFLEQSNLAGEEEGGNFKTWNWLYGVSKYLYFGALFSLEAPPFDGPKWGFPIKKVSKYLPKYFLNVFIWKVKYISATFKHPIKSNQLFANLWVPRTPTPPKSQRVKMVHTGVTQTKTGKILL